MHKLYPYLYVFRMRFFTLSSMYVCVYIYILPVKKRILDMETIERYFERKKKSVTYIYIYIYIRVIAP